MEKAEAVRVLKAMECRSPAGGLGPGTHCAACCYGTGYDVRDWDDVELVSAALVTLGSDPLPWKRP